jgi:catechol 2,3-dioxygenase-like lactoylglutathione lyase family enzyme
MPAVSRVLETSLYVDDVERAARFYEDLFGFERVFADERLCALGVAGRQVLLLFRKGASTRPTVLPGGTVPPHDGTGNLHLAFAVDASELPAWEQALRDRGIDIESRVDWPRGGRSLYFRDPDRHVLELVTPGCWSIY